MAGVTVELCLAYLPMRAAAEGFNVYGVNDGSGAPDVATRADDGPSAGCARHHARTWLMVAADLQRD